MNLSERKLAAKKFMETWKGRGYEKGESQTFWLTLLRDVLGVEHPEDIVSFESQVKLSSTSFIDAYISTTKVLIEQKSIDKDLRAPIRQSDGTLLTPFGQAKRYASELPLSMHPRYVVTCNFKSFLVYDMENPQAEPEEVLLENLDREFSRLNFLVDGASGPFQKELEVSIRAGEHVGEIYDALLPEFGSSPTAEDLHSLNVLCVRLVFCLYAEDAGIFEKEQFYLYLKSFRPENMRMALKDLFLTLDTPEPLRDKFLEPKLKNFPYVNGSLFRMRAEESIPPITEEIATVLLNRASLNFDWSEISPTIFGAVFESTLNPETRRSGGMHYTSIENIHKVIDPLFLDSFRAELEKIKKISGAKKRGAELLNFQRKLGSLKFLDPACGSGNFLTETYLSLRTLENEALSLRLHGEAVLDVYGDSIFVHIGQFYGIEINDFAVTVAKTALWIAESQMMEKTSEILQRNLEFLPLKTNANIVEGNALRMDWNLGNRGEELGDRSEELGNGREELGDRGEELGYGGEDEKLRGSDGLAKSHGFGRGNLLAGEDASQGRTVFFARSNETGGNIDSVEYCGRFRSQESERVLSVSAHCAGVGNGVGNTIENLRPDTISDRGTNRKSHGFVDSGRQNECGASNSSELTSRSLSPTSQYDYIMGNPPFVGARLMNAEQKKDVLSVFGNVKNAGNLDYVSCWYKKTADMLKGSSTKAALVSTNSITQGEQPAILWKPLMQEGIEIDFAYRTFRWDSESAQKAHVHCVIVGFGMGKDPLAMTDAGRVSTQSAKVNALKSFPSERQVSESFAKSLKSSSYEPQENVLLAMTDAGRVSPQSAKENALKSSPSERQVSESFAKSLKSSSYEPQENDAFAKFPKSSSYETQENDASAKSQECSLSETLGHDASPHRETVRSESSVPDVNCVNPQKREIYTHGNLPHWHIDGALQFVTFRLADSLPKEKRLELEEMEKAFLKNHPKPWSSDEEEQHFKIFGNKIEKYVKAGLGSCCLRSKNIRKIVEEAFFHFDGERYKIHSFVIMPNHVHVLVEPFGQNTLSEITHSWKSFSAHEIAKVLKSNGSVWQKESFDRLIRDEKHYKITLEYIKKNPFGLKKREYSFYSIYEPQENVLLAMTDAGRVSTQSAKVNALKSSPSERQVSESFAKSQECSLPKTQGHDAPAKSQECSLSKMQENESFAKFPKSSSFKTLGHDASPHRETVRSDASSPKFIFTESGEKIPVKNINAYLVDAPNVFIESRKKPLCDVPEIGIGNQPIDGGNYLFTEEEMRTFIKKEPRSEKYFRKWLGSDEFINRYFRYCLWLGDADPQELVKMPLVMERVKAVRKFRLASKRLSTLKIADKPTRFQVENMPAGNYILIPEVSSEKRRYIPMGFISPNILCSNLVKLIPGASLYHFGILTSSVHMAWTRAVCGRLKSDYRYSKDIVYNNFPWPDLVISDQGLGIREQGLGIKGGEVYDNEFQRADCLAEGDEPGRRNLSNCQKASERGDLCAFGPDETRRSVDSVEHCGGARQKFNEGIYSISGNSERFCIRTGNSASFMCENKISNGIRSPDSDESAERNSENNQFDDNKTQKQKLEKKLIPDHYSLITETAKAVLTARAKYPNCSLAELYGENMFLFPELRKAHQENDRVVMRAYGFDERMTESEIVAALFEMHRNLVAGG